MNPDLQAAAEALLYALRMKASDAYWGGIPEGPDFDLHETGTTEYPWAEVAELQLFYQPHRLLPPVGQELWRDLQGMIDPRLRRERPDAPSPPVDPVQLQKTIDALIHWLVITYKLDVPIPEKGKPKLGRDCKPAGDDLPALRTRMMVIVSARHSTPGEQQYVPYTQDELAQTLGCSQTQIHRAVTPMFKGKGWAGYKGWVEELATRGDSSESAAKEGNGQRATARKGAD